MAGCRLPPPQAGHDLLGIEEHDFGDFGEEGIPEHLGIAFDIAAAVDPAALVAAGLDVVEILRLEVALVGLEALAAAGAAGFGAGVDGVEELGLDGQIVAAGPGSSRTSWGT